MLDARLGDDRCSGGDDDFIILVDLEERSFEESATDTLRSLSIDFEAGASQIEVIGTCVISVEPSPRRHHAPQSLVVEPPLPPRAAAARGGYPIGGALEVEFGSQGSGLGEFLVPHGIAFGPDGIMAVADILNNRIQVFYPNGTFAFQLGLSGPSGYISYIAFGPDGRLAVSDIKNHRVQVFRLQYP